MSKDEKAPIMVKYKWNNDNKYGDLVCEITEFMDKYLLSAKATNTLYRTYLYNDLGAFSDDGFLHISFRVPRGYSWGYTIKKIR